MNILHKILGRKPTKPATGHNGNASPDQLSVDVAIASQQNNQAALRVRHTLSQLLDSADLASKPR